MSAAKLSKLQKYLQIVGRFTPRGFSSILGVDSESILKNFDSIVSHDNSRLKFRYRIPEHLCVSQGILGAQSHGDNEVKRLPLSAFLAIFDELTTHALVVEDKKTRPGVSVHLSAQFVHPSLAFHGNNVEFYVKAVKVGHSFGFTEAEAVCVDSGKTICRGQHTKFLPIGSWIQEFVLGPALPFTSWFTATFKPSEINKNSNYGEDHIEDILSLNEGKFSVEKHHCNGLNSLHGGCQAMLLEKTFSKDRRRDDSKLYSLSVTYMAAAKLSSEINCQANEMGSRDSKIPCVSTVTINDLKGRLLSEGICQFAPSSSL